MPYDQPVDADDDDAWQAPQHFLEDMGGNPAEEVETAEWQANTQESLHGALGDLDERSRDIVMQRWLSENKSTLHELADQYGVSAERIRQLEANAMKKLRTAMAA